MIKFNYTFFIVLRVKTVRPMSTSSWTPRCGIRIKMRISHNFATRRLTMFTDTGLKIVKKKNNFKKFVNT